MKNQPSKKVNNEPFQRDLNRANWVALAFPISGKINPRRDYILTTLFLSMLLALSIGCPAQSVGTDSVALQPNNSAWRDSIIKNIGAQVAAITTEVKILEKDTGGAGNLSNGNYAHCDNSSSAAADKIKLSRVRDTLTHFGGQQQLWHVYKTVPASGVAAKDAGLNGHALQNYTYMSIRYKQHNFQILEEYIEKNGALIFARQSLYRKAQQISNYTDLIWNCALYFQNGAFMDMTSLGHGKTEDPAWDPQSLVEDYHQRKLQLQGFK